MLGKVKAQFELQLNQLVNLNESTSKTNKVDKFMVNSICNQVS